MNGRAGQKMNKMAESIETFLRLVETPISEGSVFAGMFKRLHRDFEPLAVHEFQQEDSEWLVPTFLRPTDLTVRANVGMFHDNHKGEPNTVLLSGLRQVSPSEVRGRVTAIYPYMYVHWEQLIDRETPHGLGVDTIAAWLGQDRWLDIRVGAGGNNPASVSWKADPARRWIGYAIGGTWGGTTARPLHKEWRQQIQLSLGLQFRRDYYWTLTIGPEKGPKLRIPTDAIGIDKFLSLRDKGTRHRRESLIHWVEQHWQRLRSDPEMETMVRRHLRGRDEFCWGDWGGHIHVSLFDLERVNIADEVRKQLRTEHSDRRQLSSDIARWNERQELRAQRLIDLHETYRRKMLDEQREREPQPVTFPYELMAANSLNI